VELLVQLERHRVSGAVHIEEVEPDLGVEAGHGRGVEPYGVPYLAAQATARRRQVQLAVGQRGADRLHLRDLARRVRRDGDDEGPDLQPQRRLVEELVLFVEAPQRRGVRVHLLPDAVLHTPRSEERRVGKECRTRRSTERVKTTGREVY